MAFERIDPDIGGDAALAQLGVAAVVLPLGYLLSRGASIRRALLPLGSAAAGLVATLWFAERAFDLAVFS